MSDEPEVRVFVLRDGESHEDACRRAGPPNVWTRMDMTPEEGRAHCHDLERALKALAEAHGGRRDSFGWSFN